MTADPGPLITPWSELEGREIAKAIEGAEAEGDAELTNKLKAIDLRVVLRTGDKRPDWLAPNLPWPPRIVAP